jgi:hypothetical protein
MESQRIIWKWTGYFTKKEKACEFKKRDVSLAGRETFVIKSRVMCNSEKTEGSGILVQ